MAYADGIGIVCGECGSPCPGGPNECCRTYDNASEEVVSFSFEIMDEHGTRRYEVAAPREALARTQARLAEVKAEACDLLRQGLRSPHDGWRYRVERFLAEHDREPDTG